MPYYVSKLGMWKYGVRNRDTGKVMQIEKTHRRAQIVVDRINKAEYPDHPNVKKNLEYRKNKRNKNPIIRVTRKKKN